MKRNILIAAMLATVIGSSAWCVGCTNAPAGSSSGTSEESRISGQSAAVSSVSTAEGTSHTEESSRPEDSRQAEESTYSEESSVPMLGIGESLWKEGEELPAYVSCSGGIRNCTIRNEEAIRRFFGALAQTKIGDETEDMAEEVNGTISYYLARTEQVITMEFNGDHLVQDGKRYLLTGPEPVSELVRQLMEYEEPTPPHIRPFSSEDPYHTVPMYIVPPEEDEIAEDPETGVRYAANQLIVVLTDNNYAESVVKMSSDAQADVIGHDEEAKSYQFRFREEKTMQQLQEQAAEWEAFDFVESVSLHMVEE